MGIDIRKPLRQLLPHLIKAAEDNLNEADTRQRVCRVFEEVLGYDAMTEITQETQIRSKYVDIAVRLNGQIKFLIETKSAAKKLRDRHIEQAQHYAAEGNIPWVVLTNGVDWILYHLTFDEGVDYTRVFTVSLTQGSLDDASEQLGVLHRRSVSGHGLDEYWEHRAALKPESIGRALFADGTIKLIRREIRRREGVLIDPEDLATEIHNMLSIEAREQIGPPKIRKSTRKRRSNEARPPGRVAAPDAAPQGSTGP